MKKLLISIMLYVSTLFPMEQFTPINNGTQSVPTSPTMIRTVQPARSQTPPLERGAMPTQIQLILDEIYRTTLSQPSSHSDVGSEISDSDQSDRNVTGTLTWCGKSKIIVSVHDKDGKILVKEKELSPSEYITWTIDYFGEVLIEIKQKGLLSIFEKNSFQQKLYPLEYCAFLNQAGNFEFADDCEQCG